MEELIICRDGKKFFSVALKKSPFVLGSAPGNDLVLNGEAVRERHAEIVRGPEGLKLRCLGGGAATLNGAPVPEPGMATKPGDRIGIGAWQIEMRGGNPAREKTRILDDTPGASAANVSRPLLIIRAPDGATTYYSVVRKDTVMGNASDCDVVLDDAYVSRRHALLRRDAKGLFLIDLDSTNGTVCGGARIRERPVTGDVEFVLGRTRLELRLREPKDPSPPGTFFGMIGRSRAMRNLFAQIERAAASGMTVLVRGPTGSGKEMVARALHGLSARKNAPFVALNCGAIAPTLLESELFGHEKGAFTGAEARHPGIFEQAHGGTVFLDEVGELPLAAQTRLLRVLENRSVRRIGGFREIDVDARVIAATHRDLGRMAATGTFREDLFYRLFVVPVDVPPLKERKEDIPALLEYFLSQIVSAPRLSPGALAKLREHNWPGNVRELRNVVCRAAAYCKNGEIAPDDVVFFLRPETVAVRSRENAAERCRRREAETIRATLKSLGGDKSRAAEMLGMGRSTLFRKIKDWGIRINEEESSSGSGPLIAPQGDPEPLKKSPN